MGCGRAAGGHGGVNLLVLPYVPLKKTSLNLFPSLIRFSRGIYLHRRHCTQQSLIGSYKWSRTAGGVVRASDRTRPSELNVLVVDR